jgi:transposase
VALLHDCEAGALATWLRAHAGVTVIARDRLKAYIDGARTGAPQGTQVANRFHLLQNLAGTLDQVFSAHRHALKAVSEALSRVPVVQPDGRMAMPVPPSTPTPQAQTRVAQRRATRLALKRTEHPTNVDTQLLAQIESQHRDLAGAIALVQDFCAIVRQRQVDRFDDWLARAVASGVAPLQRFARGLRADYDAVRASLRVP